MIYNRFRYVLFITEGSMLASIRRLKSPLTDFIEPDFGLLEHLLSLGVLTSRQYDKIRAGDKAAYERSQAILDLLKSDEQCSKFMKALQKTDQQHVVNFIAQNGG